MAQNPNCGGFVYIGIVQDSKLNKKPAHVAAVGA